jgi:hypothetical protein
MNNHYVFLRPGEKIFVLTDEIAGETDYTYVIEVEIPVHPVRDPQGRQYHNPEAGRIVDARQYHVLEMNDCDNLTTGDYPGSTVLDAYARVNEKRLGNNPDHAFVARPLGKASE